MSTQQRQRVPHPEAIPPTVRNVYNLLMHKQTEYVKEEINRSMMFAQVGNDRKEYALSSLRHEGMENPKEKIDYVTVIVNS